MNVAGGPAWMASGDSDREVLIEFSLGRAGFEATTTRNDHRYDYEHANDDAKENDEKSSNECHRFFVCYRVNW